MQHLLRRRAHPLKPVCSACSKSASIPSALTSMPWTSGVLIRPGFTEFCQITFDANSSAEHSINWSKLGWSLVAIPRNFRDSRFSPNAALPIWSIRPPRRLVFSVRSKSVISKSSIAVGVERMAPALLTSIFKLPNWLIVSFINDGPHRHYATASTRY